ncbi:mitochondrial carrier domain-containing protein [Mortierella sp. GBAus27b]|nr:mitochondrial carrier domain-containing protein [Mortierella sp. GBAus27b]
MAVQEHQSESNTSAPVRLKSNHHVWTPEQELAAKLVFGGTGCTIAVVFTHPVDVIKTRLQLQGEAGTPHQPSSSTPSSIASASLAARKGTSPSTALLSSVLMAGLAPAVLRESIYSTIRFGSYDLFKGIYSGMGTQMRGGEETSTLVKLASGLTSGMIGSVIANPTDLIKVRLQAFWPSGKPRYASIADACRSIYVEEGIPGLYRGVVPTAARAMVVTASQLASYDTTKHWLLRQRDRQGEAIFREGYLTHFCASTVAGLVCSISTSPIDTVKVRYMNQQFSPSGKGALYSSAIDCAIKTVRNEGPMALYKGFSMCWLRLGPHTMLSLMIFEKLRSFVGLNPV